MKHIIEKLAEDINRYITGEKIYIANKLMRRCLTSLSSQENTNNDHKEIVFYIHSNTKY